MSSSLRHSPNARRMLQRMSADIAQSFTIHQIKAIETALVPKTHRIDVRCLIPLLGKGAYLVLAAGPNRRTHPRTQPYTHAAQQPGQLPGVLSDVITLSQSCRNSPGAFQLLTRMPKDISITFTSIQIQAIEAALVPRRHVVDVRLSLPLLGKGAYFVFAAGPNRRAHYRNLQNRNPFVMPAAIASAVVGVVAILGLVQLRGSALLAKPDPSFDAEETFHPTAVPFKKNRGECEESGRQWIDDQCIDRIHDPVF